MAYRCLTKQKSKMIMIKYNFRVNKLERKYFIFWGTLDLNLSNSKSWPGPKCLEEWTWTGPPWLILFESYFLLLQINVSLDWAATDFYKNFDKICFEIYFKLKIYINLNGLRALASRANNYKNCFFVAQVSLQGIKKHKFIT